MKTDENGFPRRNRIDLNTPAELAIRKAIESVEEAGCHELLTDAVNLLDEAREKVADFVELEPRNRGGMTDMTACIQIGNTDDKLTQKSWSWFVADMKEAIERIASEVHFFGGSETYAPWQNACWVVEFDVAEEDRLVEEIAVIRDRWNQTSVAMLCGKVQLI